MDTFAAWVAEALYVLGSARLCFLRTILLCLKTAMMGAYNRPISAPVIPAPTARRTYSVSASTTI